MFKTEYGVLHPQLIRRFSAGCYYNTDTSVIYPLYYCSPVNVKSDVHGDGRVFLVTRRNKYAV